MAAKNSNEVMSIRLIKKNEPDKDLQWPKSIMIEKILDQNENKIDACFWKKVTALRRNTCRNFKIIWNKLFDELASIKDNHKVTLYTWLFFRDPCCL